MLPVGNSYRVNRAIDKESKRDNAISLRYAIQNEAIKS